MGVIMSIMLVVMVVTKNSQTLEHEKPNQARQEGYAHAMNLTAHMNALREQMQ
jgi:hypothetical protein